MMVLDRILVRRSERPDKIGSIILADNSSAVTTYEGEILEVGPGFISGGVRVPLPFYVGDKVTYLKTQGVPIKVDGEELVVLREQDILRYTR